MIRSSFPDPSGVPHPGFARQILPLCATPLARLGLGVMTDRGHLNMRSFYFPIQFYFTGKRIKRIISAHIYGKIDLTYIIHLI